MNKILLLNHNEEIFVDVKALTQKDLPELNYILYSPLPSFELIVAISEKEKERDKYILLFVDTCHI